MRTSKPSVWLLALSLIGSTGIAGPATSKSRPVRPRRAPASMVDVRADSGTPNGMADGKIDALKRALMDGDALAARILARGLISQPLGKQQWLDVREAIQSRPILGWDVVVLWDKKKARAAYTAADQLVIQADRLMANRQFAPAFTTYQRAAQAIIADQKSAKNIAFSRPKGPNYNLLQSIYQSMGESLYASGRFSDALQVFGWIQSDFPNFRQVLFERMWAAFRADDIGAALGAVASQYSSYFAPFIEPETYLVQIYLYRKLCRQTDLALASASLQKFLAALKSGTLDWRAWAHSDVETLVLLQMLNSKVTVGHDVNEAARGAEKLRIEAVLKQKFALERGRLISESRNVAAYVALAVSADSKALPPAAALPSARELIRTGRESWPVNDAEDWIDELGHHVFIGSSQCSESH